MRGHIKVHQPAAIMLDHDKDKQNPIHGFQLGLGILVRFETGTPNFLDAISISAFRAVAAACRSGAYMADTPLDPPVPP